MRRAVFLALAILGSLSALAQSPADYNFQTDGEAVRWQRVFQAADTVRAEVILQNLHARRNCDNVLSEVPGVISFDLAFEPVAVAEDLGYSRPSLPAYITAGKYTAYVTVQIKPDRYRVTVENIRMVLPGFGDTRLEVFAIRRGDWQRRFTPAPAAIIDYYLGREFEGLEKLMLDDDDEW